MSQLSCLPPVIDDASRVLVLGTMPGHISLQKKQYYANPGNSFWKIIYGLYGLPPAADYATRIEFVKSRGIALWDVLAQCARAGSSDSNIKDIVVNDFEKLLMQYPGIRCIAFSSRKAFQLFDKHVDEHSRQIERRLIKLVVLPSPSGRYARMAYPEKLDGWRKITEFLKD